MEIALTEYSYNYMIIEHGIFYENTKRCYIK